MISISQCRSIRSWASKSEPSVQNARSVARGIAAIVRYRYSTREYRQWSSRLMLTCKFAWQLSQRTIRMTTSKYTVSHTNNIYVCTAETASMQHTNVAARRVQFMKREERTLVLWSTATCTELYSQYALHWIPQRAAVKVRLDTQYCKWNRCLTSEIFSKNNLRARKIWKIRNGVCANLRYITHRRKIYFLLEQHPLASFRFWHRVALTGIMRYPSAIMTVVRTEDLPVLNQRFGVSWVASREGREGDHFSVEAGKKQQ